MPRQLGCIIAWTVGAQGGSIQPEQGDLLGFYYVDCCLHVQQQLDQGSIPPSPAIHVAFQPIQVGASWIAKQVCLALEVTPDNG